MATLLEKIAQSGIHVLVVSKVENGGTNTTLVLIDEINKTYTHRCQFFIISPINNQQWMGLESVKNEYKVNDEVVSSPAVVYPFGAIDAPQAIEQIKIVYQILQQRIQSGVTQDDVDISLVVKEWHSLYQALRQAPSTEVYESVMSMLVELVARGREFKVRLILESASSNIADVGFSTALRESFATVVVERINKNERCQVIPQVIKAPWFKNSDNKAHLDSLLNEIYAAVTENYQFVVLSDFGEGAIEVLPDLSELSNTVLFGQ